MPVENAQPSVTAGEDALASAPGAGAVDPLASSLVDPLVAHASGAQPHAASHRAHITFETDHADPQGLGAHHERVLNGPTYDSSDWQQANKEGEASAQEKKEFFKRRARALLDAGVWNEVGDDPDMMVEDLWTEITQAANTANEEISKHLDDYYTFAPESERDKHMKSIDRWVDLSSETYLKAQECFEGLAAKLVQMTSQSLDNVQSYGLWSGWTGDEYARKNLDITMTSSGIAAVFGNKAISNLIGDASTIDRRGQPLWGALSRAYAIMVKERIESGGPDAPSLHVCIGGDWGIKGNRSMNESNVFAKIESKELESATFKDNIEYIAVKVVPKSDHVVGNFGGWGDAAAVSRPKWTEGERGAFEMAPEMHLVKAKGDAGKETAVAAIEDQLAMIDAWEQGDAEVASDPPRDP